jgi:hypothetical protein
MEDEELLIAFGCAWLALTLLFACLWAAEVRERRRWQAAGRALARQLAAAYDRETTWREGRREAAEAEV